MYLCALRVDCVVMIITLGVLISLASCHATAESTPSGPTGPSPSGQAVPWTWAPIWSGKAGSATLADDPKAPFNGRVTSRIEQTAPAQWCLQPDGRADKQPLALPVRQGDVVDVSARVKVDGAGRVSVSWVSADHADAALPAVWGDEFDVTYGAGLTYRTADFVQARARFVVPAGVHAVLPRIVGSDRATVWVGELAITRSGNVADVRSGAPDPIRLQNQSLSVEIAPGNGALSVEDRRTRQVWVQQPLSDDVVVLDATASGPRRAQLALLCVPLDLKLQATIALDPSAPELSVTLTGDGALPGGLNYPYPFESRPGMDIIVPQDEGMTYPVDDSSIRPFRYNLYSGYGLCMRFWGINDGGRAVMAIVQTPDDAAVNMNRRGDGLLYLAPEWIAQRGRVGYPRTLRYVFFDQGGYVAMCKRYRAYAQQIGLFKTLAQKRQERPNIDKLVGSANIWCRDRRVDPVAMARQLQAAGIERFIWSGASSRESILALNEMGILTSRMDNYQDVRNPSMGGMRAAGAAATGPATTQGFAGAYGGGRSMLNRAWPDDVVIDAQGDWIKGWEVRGTFNAVMCDVQGIRYADQIIGLDLQNLPVTARFVDTTMCTAWHECYNPAHPMTRTQSRDARVELLRLVSDKYKLVCGSENGNDIAVPVADYFEGMLSIGPYRVPDSGRGMQAILDEATPDLVKFQADGKYRLPLWELVYHECALAHWYWGDYNNKVLPIWEGRDLVNALYGTAPLYMFDRAFFETNKDRFVASYRATVPIARACGYAEMTDHRYLTPDRNVQQSTWANGVRVTVNFGSEPYTAADGSIIAPRSAKTSGMTEPGGRAEAGVMTEPARLPDPSQP